MWLKELTLNSPWPGLPGMDWESHVNNVLMIYHLRLLPGLFLLPLCFAHTAGVTHLKSELDIITSLLKTFPQLPSQDFCGRTWSGPCLHLQPHFLPFSPSFAQPHGFLAVPWPCQEHALTQGLCASSVLPGILSPTPSQGLPCNFYTNVTYQKGLSWPLYIIALKKGFSEGPLLITLHPHPLITCFIAFHSTCLLVYFLSSPSHPTRMWALWGQRLPLLPWGALNTKQQ